MVKCAYCGKTKGYHLAHTFNCPTGMKTRIGWTQFAATVFTPPGTPKRIKRTKR